MLPSTISDHRMLRAKSLEPKTITDIDGYLRPNVAAIIQRHNAYRHWKETIDKHEGGYDKFTKGYLRYGLNVGPNNEVIYREWAPNAKEAYLIGDFSKYSLTLLNSSLMLVITDEWNRTINPMVKNDFGVWEITVPPLPSGKCAIPHDTKIKVSTNLRDVVWVLFE